MAPKKLDAPKNGRYYRAVLCGGDPEKQTVLGKALPEKYRTEIALWAPQKDKTANWPDKNSKPVDVLITLDKHNNHPLYLAAVKWAKGAGIPIIRTSTDQTKWANTFRTRGLKLHSVALWQLKSVEEEEKKKKETAKEAAEMAAAQKKRDDFLLQQEREAELANEDLPLSNLAKDPNGFMRALRLVIRTHHKEGYKSLLIENSKVLMERIED